MTYYPDNSLAVAELVTERRLTSEGPGDWYFLKLGDGRLIPLGDDKDFATGFRWSIVRNVCDNNGWVRCTDMPASFLLEDQKED